LNQLRNRRYKDNWKKNNGGIDEVQGVGLEVKRLWSFCEAICSYGYAARVKFTCFGCIVGIVDHVQCLIEMPGWWNL
jgi:hypothetical protein